MIRERNSDREVELRKYQSILITVGKGIMAFTAWTLVKLISMFFVYQDRIYDFAADAMETSGQDLGGIPESVVVYLFYAVSAVIILAALLVQLWVGSSARARGEGRRVRLKNTYIFFAFIMALNGISSLIEMVRNSFSGTASSTPQGLQSSFVVELTMFVMTAEMIYASFRVNRLESEGRHAKR